MISSSCGLGHWRPKWIQRFANRKYYLATFTIIGILQGITFTYLSSVLSTVERKFGLSSQETAWVYSGNEISQAFFILALPFIGQIKKRPLYMGLSIVVSGIGVALCGLPHFFSSSLPLSKQSSSNLCHAEGNILDQTVKEDCGRDLTGVSVIFIGIFLSGIGTSFYFSLGLPYVDDNTSKEKSPMALAFVIAMRMTGPIFGNLVAAFFLKLYQDPRMSTQSLGFDESDSRWIGAWWLGFFVIGFALLIVAPLLTLFPGKLPGNQTTDADIFDKSQSVSQKSAKKWFEELKAVSGRLLRNKIYVCHLLSSITFLFGIIGFITFFPKYLEFNFRRKASNSGVTSSLGNFLPSMIGLLFSGWMLTKYKFKAQILAGWIIFVEMVAILFFIGMIFLGCAPIVIQGYNNEKNLDTIESVSAWNCSSDCSCFTSQYDPICSHDGATQYFSPCHAGCKKSRLIPGIKRNRTVFWDCSCLDTGSKSNNWIRSLMLQEEEEEEKSIHPLHSSEIQYQAIDSYCNDEKCNFKFYGFLAGMCIFGLISSSTRVPGTLISLRAINVQDKAASLTLSISLLSIFAFLPSTIVAGVIIDKSCVIWGYKCGIQSNCLVYNTDQMRLYMNLFISICLLISMLFDIAVWKLVKNMSLFDQIKEDKTTESTSSTANTKV